MGHGMSCWPQTAIGLSRQNPGSPSQKLGSERFICVLVAVCDGGYGMDEGSSPKAAFVTPALELFAVVPLT